MSTLTTGQISKICQVAPRTVSKWIDTGALKGYVVPVSRARRVHIDDLTQFILNHNMPAEMLAAAKDAAAAKKSLKKPKVQRPALPSV